MINDNDVIRYLRVTVTGSGTQPINIVFCFLMQVVFTLFLVEQQWKHC